MSVRSHNAFARNKNKIAEWQRKRCDNCKNKTAFAFLSKVFDMADNQMIKIELCSNQNQRGVNN